MRARWSATDPDDDIENSGELEVWHQHVLVIPPIKVRTFTTTGVYLKQGLYRPEETFDAIVRHDAMRVTESDPRVDSRQAGALVRLITSVLD